jgi:hypothetical protein
VPPEISSRSSVSALSHCTTRRPLCTHPDVPRRLLSGELAEAPAYERTLSIRRRGWLSPASPLFLAKALNVLGAQGWYYLQLFRLADGLAPDLQLGVLRAFRGYVQDELATARRMRAARSVP